MAGFAMGGPFGAVVGAALGHAAESGGMGQINPPRFSFPGMDNFGPARLAALLGQRDQVFAISVVVLAAKLSKCDGPVNREEIDAFKRVFRIPPASLPQVGRLFDQAREQSDGYEGYAKQLGGTFADNRGMLEDVLAALFLIARADKPLTLAEQAFLRRVHVGFGLDEAAWERASGARARTTSAAAQAEEDPYAVLGLARGTTDAQVRATWKRLMRENHPDSLASRGVPPEFIARASDKVARINAAWDRIKRERGL
ncbi:TerB family tellurite resistance protein [Rhodovastum atsumiense]|uniref:Molecular chaperone DjlA n=1 Tax=Rhodovastum atsumiense TaxID=504468 RepID=A0A5M6J0G4_9PROT|nr:TerB family tellurite resistance protein [Rhodovastum atsumiense]KAA5613577.1 molecular chaperone DjlA [Rhodovastum atsumiense]